MDFREHAINREWSAEGKIDLPRQMLRIRRFEQAALESDHDMPAPRITRKIVREVRISRTRRLR